MPCAVAAEGWGKTEYLKTIAADAAAKGRNVFWGAPDYKIQAEAFSEVADILNPIKRASSKVEGVIRTVTDGRIDFWSLENERAGRSRKYHLAIIDEGAFTKPNMADIFRRAIRPSLLDYKGSCVVVSTPNGDSPSNFFYRVCNDALFDEKDRLGFTEYHSPTWTNPHLPADEIELLRASNHPLVFRQEYEAEFVDFSGTAFFSVENLLVDGRPIQLPLHVDCVFATIDTAVKTGRENDGTGVCFWAKSNLVGHPLTLLDWDIVQIEGALLETWLPTVFQLLEHYAVLCKARGGSIGAFIEDKASGSILLQQAARRGWPATPIESGLTAVGKDERAISVSGYVYQGKVKMTEHAYNKTVNHKGQERNHFITQFCGYRIGVKDQMDDLLDAGCYGIAIALGNSDGY